MLLRKIQAIVDLKNENSQLKASQYREDFFTGMTSPAMSRLDEFVRKVAPTDASVLLVGESGTGKSELARFNSRKIFEAGETICGSQLHDPCGKFA